MRTLFERAVTRLAGHTWRRQPKIRHNVIATSLVVACIDYRYIEVQWDFCERNLRLGKLYRDWLLLPIAGGAAAFAHPDRIPGYFGTLERQLQIQLEHFPTVTHLYLFGHWDCNFVANLHRGEEAPVSGKGWVYEDCLAVARAVAKRRVIGDCKIGKAVHGFMGDVRVIYTGIKQGTVSTPSFEIINGE